MIKTNVERNFSWQWLLKLRALNVKHKRQPTIMHCYEVKELFVTRL